MSAQTEDDWREAFGVDADDLDADGWADLWERHDGDVDDIASYVGISFPETLRELAAAGVYEHDEWSTHYVERLIPEDFGLDPLNCTRCGELAISDHACPSCGFDPREEAGAMCDVCGRRYASLSTDSAAYCDECHQEGERLWWNPITDELCRVTAWRRVDGRLVPLEREPFDLGDLEDVRERAGLSHGDVAAAIGTDDLAVRRWEREDCSREPSIAYQRELGEIFGDFGGEA